MTEREKLYVCMDVDLPRHARIMSLPEPLACLGLWGALVAHAREQLTSGKVPKRTAETMCGERNAKRLASMVGSELLSFDGTDYTILRYAPRNQTKDMVEASRKSARDRKAASRVRLPDVTCDSPVTDDETDEGQGRDSMSTRGRARISSSPSISESSGLEGVQGEPSIPTNADRMVRRTDPMPAECQRVLDTLLANEFGGAPIRDAALEWSKFTAHYDGKLWLQQRAAKWQKWAIKAWQDQRAADRKEQQLGRPPIGSGPQNPPKSRYFRAGDET